MKKIVLSSFLILSFFSYVLYKKSVTAAPVTTTTTSTNYATEPDTTPTDGVVVPTTAPIAGAYRDGTYTGDSVDAFYGYIQVKAVVSGGKLTDVIFLKYPNDRDRSIFINQQAMPYLKQEAIQSQGAMVNIVSGATDSSEAFIKSLSTAIAQART